ncbi:MAG: 2-aminoethylphosphonate--pyruvate transaminase [Phycisphaerales bacterium]|nr:2-aminoethylphosphonate--pyruvate transaminase [Phycisphaerales bacterium]
MPATASTDKLLFTPGPLTTSMSVKQAMLRDLGSRDAEFIATVRRVRSRLLAAAGLSRQDGYEAVLLQGSGTYGIEAVLTCAVPPGGKWLAVANGTYGERMVKILRMHRIDHAVIRAPENQPTDPTAVDAALATDPAITAVAVVHCETTTGLMNPVEQIGRVVHQHGRTFFVDSMSAFGAVEFGFRAAHIDFLVSSSNKCIEGVPGFSFCIARREALLASETWSRTLVLDLCAQWKGLDADGQFRFTPPTHAILAFDQALSELEAEGGPAGRAARYSACHRTLVAGMKAMGFEMFLPPEIQGHIITSFRCPADPNFQFDAFYRHLSDRGYVIYPGKVSQADCFRIGTIGRLTQADVTSLLDAIADVLSEMGITNTSAS